MAEKLSSTENNEYTLYYNLLNSTLKTRLVYNTKSEFSNLLDVNLNTNSLDRAIKKRSFNVKSIFYGLNQKIQEDYDKNLNLKDILSDYEETSDYYCKHIKHRKFEDEDICELLMAYISDDYIVKSKKITDKKGMAYFQRQKWRH